MCHALQSGAGTDGDALSGRGSVGHSNAELTAQLEKGVRASIASAASGNATMSDVMSAAVAGALASLPTPNSHSQGLLGKASKQAAGQEDVGRRVSDDVAPVQDTC